MNLGKARILGYITINMLFFCMILIYPKLYGLFLTLAIFNTLFTIVYIILCCKDKENSLNQAIFN